MAAVSGFAQNGTPSSKATAAINTAVGCTFAAQSTIGDTLPVTCTDIFSGTSVPVTADNFATIMKSTIKVSNSQSLFVSPSLVTGLYTQTRTKTSTGGTSTAQAMGAVYLRAVLSPADGGPDIVASPLNLCDATILGCANQGGHWGVVLDSRIQTLTQSLSTCTVLVDGGGTGTCDFTSVIDLVLQTSSAHTFNLIFPNVGVGVYTLKIYGAVASDASILAGSGTAVGAAAFGLGSVTADSVRLVHDFSF
jgi:hypothetical protein